ncbi:hypothetical protein [Micromonospora sp. NBC_01813]|uniref:hypothetical protein n=1 Tax=Micromonospora sp. NBC_01813 TaxID=2975988 RepID=UPI002DD9CAFD|nr:hypothetical protein [Micromonospora sp. NBC_01813]WSA11365.1 hypothetical protein OG958_11620 [Micromonospora sp. NBC_01813]
MAGNNPPSSRYGLLPDQGPTPNRPGAQVLAQAREAVAVHMPSRLAECRACDGPALCSPFTSALVVLDRWDHGKARRVRAVLQYAGLWPRAIA